MEERWEHPTEAIIVRKVTISGVIWVDGHAYYVSRRLAGQSIPVRVSHGRILVDTQVPLRKEYALAQRTAVARLRRPRGWRQR